MTLPHILKKTAGLAASMLLAGATWAHDDAWLDAQKTPHGGQMRAAGELHLELVLDREASAARTSTVAVYLTDHGGKPVETKGAQGKVTLLGEGGKREIALQPAEGNRLQGNGTYVASAALKGIVSVTLPGRKAVQARFTPFAAERSDAHAGHKH